jgi:hypothetical protein
MLLAIFFNLDLVSKLKNWGFGVLLNKKRLEYLGLILSHFTNVCVHVIVIHCVVCIQGLI